jgi:UDP-N-acetyl-D-mannosaminuronic acid transferase (WecB/TagA/CpsF family)
LIAGSAGRAPRWIERACAEWLYRLAREPRRFASRHFRDTVFRCRTIVGDLSRGRE